MKMSPTVLILSVLFFVGGTAQASVSVASSEADIATGDAWVNNSIPESDTAIFGVSEVADGWQWYEFAPMKLKDSFTFDFKPGRFAKGGGRGAVDAVYFDRMEIRAE